MSVLVVASGNAHKVAELRAMLQDALGVERVRGLSDFDNPPLVEENADTFEGNATLKARAHAAFLASLGEPGSTLVLADDSGLSVDALGGEPGVRSARFAGEQASDADNNRKLVRELGARGLKSSAAHYSCVLALCRVDGAEFGGRDLHCFSGRWPVEVRVDARGDGGFGYDPLAWIEGGARTVAELDPASKAAASHRGHALRALLAGWPLRTA